MKKITIIGGGAWGSTLGQILKDNNKQVLIYDINKEYIQKINNQKHPVFNTPLLKIQATNDLKKAINYSEIIILCIPTQIIRKILKQIQFFLTTPKSFINTSKGIEKNSNKTIFQIVNEEIESKKIKNYACLLGPSHAEEVILRKITFLLAASNNKKFASKIAQIFSNQKYLKVNISNDVIGCEICSAFKNALSLISGLLSDNQYFQKNAQAAFLTLGIEEMKKTLSFFSHKTKTVLNLSGIGDLIVTSFNPNSRNFQAGKKIRLGKNLDEISKKTIQTIEGIYNLKVFYDLSIKKNIFLPIIQSAYEVVFNKKNVSYILETILKKD